MKASSVLAVCFVIGVSVVAGAFLERSAVGQTFVVTTVTDSLSQAQSSASSQSAITDYSVCFSPGGTCSSQLISQISNATSSIHIMIYEFSNTAIADALVQAKQRGVDVKVIMDGSEASSQNVGVVAILNQSHIPLKVYTPLNGILHDKVAIIDNQTVVTGSYNWSYSAENFNDENLLVLHSPTLAAQYEADFQKLWSENSTLPP